MKIRWFVLVALLIVGLSVAAMVMVGIDTARHLP